MTHNRPETRRSRSWEAVADWYAGWTGEGGSRHHRELAVPLLMELMAPRAGERIADLGCGPGILAPPVAALGARLVGIDLSPRMIARARQAHGPLARFHVGDVTRARHLPFLAPESFDAACFLLSIQDINPLEEAIASAAWLLKPGGRLVLVMLHPCFRIPRQSGWGWDEGRALHYRRVDSYLSPLAVPMEHRRGTTRSYHRPLEAYVAALGDAGLAVTGLRETREREAGAATRPLRRARAEFPLLLGLRAEKAG